MQKQSSNKRQFIHELFKLYEQGETDGFICLKFGISEHNLYSIFRNYPELKKQAAKKRLMNREKRKRKQNKQINSKQFKSKPTQQRAITDKEKIKELERKLKAEQEKNRELEGFLEMAKEFLGKS